MTSPALLRPTRARIELAKGDPLSGDSRHLAILCAGAGDTGVCFFGFRWSARRQGGRAARHVWTDLAISTFNLSPRFVGSRPNFVVAVGNTVSRPPVVSRRIRERIEAVPAGRASAISPAFNRSFLRKSMHARNSQFPIRRCAPASGSAYRWADRPRGAGRPQDEAEKALTKSPIPAPLRRRASNDWQGLGHGDAGRRRPGRSRSAHLKALRALRMPRSVSTTNWVSP